MKSSPLESHFLLLVKGSGLPAPVREYRFAPPRRIRFDFCWKDRMTAAECEGGVWTHGAHTRGKHFIQDCTKYNLAALLGWKVFRFTEWHLKKDAANTIRIIKEALNG